MKISKKWSGYLFLSPWLLGVLLFTAFPMVFATVISFTDWPILGKAEFIGLGNYREIVRDPDFWNALKVTVRYAALAVPLGIAASFTISLFLTSPIRGIPFYRALYYMPAIVSGVAVAVIWKWILSPRYGIINGILARLGVEGPNWLGDPAWVLPSYLLIAIWGAGGGILTYLVGLKDVSGELYEAAEIDGGGFFRKLFSITLPMMTPIFYYNLVMGVIASFRKFTDAYIIGGAGGEGNFYMVYLYTNAFGYFRMGYATALAWILFFIILGITLIINRTTQKWMFTG